ncbi:MAG: hypothetical protein AB1Z23_03615 [Eubacteriales bacterium]
MEKRIKFARSCYSVVKMDEHIWSEISRYLQSKYDEISVSIERDDETDIADSMGFAYDIVREHSDKIIHLKIKAISDDEECQLVFRTKREKTGYSMRYEEKCRDKEAYREAQIFSDKLLSMVQASTNMIRLSSIVFFYTVFYIAMVILRENLMNRWFVYVMLAASAAIAVLLDFYVYNPMLEDWLYSGQRVQFWVDEASIAKYKNMNRKGKAAGWLIFFSACLVMLLVTFNT